MSSVNDQDAAIWRNLSESFTPRVDEVHIWRIGLDWPALHVRRWEQVLAQEERTRAGRYRFERDRNRFITRRGCLRWLLGRYLDIQPAEIKFEYNAYGKPGLAADFANREIRFNLSHSAGVALFGFARSGEIGIDIERIQPSFDFQAIAERFFSSAEQAALAALDAPARPAAFYACWTRKEAYIKARGEGLSIPLDQFDVSLLPGEPARLLDVRAGDAQDVARWNLFPLEPGPDYAGAVCAPHIVSSLVYHVLGDPMTLSLE